MLLLTVNFVLKLSGLLLFIRKLQDLWQKNMLEVERLLYCFYGKIGGCGQKFYSGCKVRCSLALLNSLVLVLKCLFKHPLSFAMAQFLLMAPVQCVTLTASLNIT